MNKTLYILFYYRQKQTRGFGETFKFQIVSERYLRLHQICKPGLSLVFFYRLQV